MPKTFSSKPVNRGGSADQVAALERQLRRLRTWETDSEVYREMLAAADQSVFERDRAPRKGNGHAMAEAF